jgi:hypothetical protein
MPPLELEVGSKVLDLVAKTLQDLPHLKKINNLVWGVQKHLMSSILKRNNDLINSIQRVL